MPVLLNDLAVSAVKKAIMANNYGATASQIRDHLTEAQDMDVEMPQLYAILKAMVQNGLLVKKQSPTRKRVNEYSIVHSRPTNGGLDEALNTA